LTSSLPANSTVVKKKRDWSLYSRSERNKRKLEDAATDCLRIDEFFKSFQETLESLLQKSKRLKAELVSIMRTSLRQTAVSDVPEGISELFKMTIDCAKRNAGRKPGGLRFDSTLKEFGTLVFTMGGLEQYEILSKNFPLPSVTTVRRHLAKSEVIREGEFRHAALKEFLDKGNHSCTVWISEDGTRINGRVQYSPRTNQLVGFVPPLDGNGIPIPDSFPATSAEEMTMHFKSKSATPLTLLWLNPLVLDRRHFSSLSSVPITASLHLMW